MLIHPALLHFHYIPCFLFHFTPQNTTTFPRNHEINHYYCAHAHLLNRNIFPTPRAMSNTRIAGGPSWSMMFSTSEWGAYPSKPLQKRIDRPATDFPTHPPHTQRHPTPGDLNSQDQQRGSRVKSDKKASHLQRCQRAEPGSFSANRCGPLGELLRGFYSDQRAPRKHRASRDAIRNAGKAKSNGPTAKMHWETNSQRVGLKSDNPDCNLTLPSKKSPSQTLDNHELRVHKSTPVFTASGTAITIYVFYIFSL